MEYENNPLETRAVTEQGFAYFECTHNTEKGENCKSRNYLYLVEDENLSIREHFACLSIRRSRINPRKFKTYIF